MVDGFDGERGVAVAGGRGYFLKVSTQGIWLLIYQILNFFFFFGYAMCLVPYEITGWPEMGLRMNYI